MLDRQSVGVSKPIRVLELKVRLDRIARIVDVHALTSAGVSLEAITDEHWNLPNKIAAAVDWMGVAGLLVPSARHADANLVILVNHLTPGEYIEPIE